MTYWSLSFLVREIGSKKDFSDVDGPSAPIEGLWLAIVNGLEKTMPSISYFPTFLVDMPNQIHLREHEGETSLNRYYREVIEDVLQKLAPKLSLKTHVLERIEAFRSKENSAQWFSVFSASPTKSNVDAVFQKLSNALTKEVLGSWSKVFNRPSGAKSIFAEWNIDTRKSNMPYVSFYVSDGESRYSMSERSLGFRWFFSFLLFTAFKGDGHPKTIFLFDEPAANLHARAQAELLENFGKIATNGNRIIYSTHSHHMIDPRWLSISYIIDNKAIDYENQHGFSLDSRPTEITATRYRHFVGQYPTRTSYFQPVIEKLDYVSPGVVGGPPFLLVEGISDYYAFRFARDIDNQDAGFSIIPGSGAGSSGPLISYLLGRGERFFILLDDDKAGRVAFENYKEKYFLMQDDMATLASASVKWTGKRLEHLISPSTKSRIRERMELNGPPSKKEIGMYLAESCATKKTDAMTEDTVANIASIISFVKGRIIKKRT